MKKEKKRTKKKQSSLEEFRRKEPPYNGSRIAVDDGRLMASITKMIDGDKYCDSVMDNPGVFVPQRKFLPIPYCPICGNEMKLVQKEAECVFECKNENCTQELQLRIE